MSILKTYIQNALKTGNLVIDNSTKGRINALITKELDNWTGPKSVSTPTTIRSLVAYEVNKFKSYGYSPAESVVREKANKVASAKRSSGVITVLKLSPLQGQLDTGELISFTSKYAIKVGEIYKYTYNAKTGVYTVHTYQKPFIKPLTGVYSGGDTLSEHIGYRFKDQSPDFTTNGEKFDNNSDTYDMLTDYDRVSIRLGPKTIGYIKDKKYYELELKLKDSIETLEIVKTVDLSNYLTVDADEALSIGKYILINDYLYILVFKHKPFPLDYAEQNTEVGKTYNYRKTTARIRGELLVLHRIDNTIHHKTASKVLIDKQIYWTGIVDILKDEASDNIILAELSETPSYRTLTYDTAIFYIDKADRRPVATTSVTKTSTEAFYTWLTTEYSNRGMPAKVHIVKDGSKSWELAYPELTISKACYLKETGFKYTETLLKDKTEITSRHAKDCVGGYINCILYQDIFDTENNYPIYIARGYDAWVQFPYLAADYTVIPKIATVGFLFDGGGPYANSAVPGELIGFFGMEYFKLAKNMSKDAETTMLAMSIATIPGDYGLSRSFAKDDIAGTKSASGFTTTTYATLVQLNNMQETELAQNIRFNNIGCTFTGGPGVHALAVATATTINRGFEYLWGTGIHAYVTRFAILKDKITREAYLVIAGSNDVFKDSYYDTNLDRVLPLKYGYATLNFTEDIASNGIYLVKLNSDKDHWPIVILLAYASYAATNNIKGSFFNPDPAYWVGPQRTFYSSRIDIKLLTDYSYYAITSVMRRQYDIYSYVDHISMDGWLWWYHVRSMCSLENNLLHKLDADTIGGDLNKPWHWGIDEEYGVMTPQLQYY